MSITHVELEEIATLLRCENTQFRHNGETGELSTARSDLRDLLDTKFSVEPPQLPRALLVHLCRLQIELERSLYPAMAIGCALHTRLLDQKAFAAELAARPAAVRDVMLKRTAESAAIVDKRANEAFPRAKAAREWEIFFEVPLKVRETDKARRRDHASAYKALADFTAASAAGTFQGCEVPLRSELVKYVRPSASTFEAARARMTDPLGFALADALARCHYYNERPLEMAAMLMVLAKGPNFVTVADQVFFAQRTMLIEDEPKAKKFPNLAGSKYSSVAPDHVFPPQPKLNKLDEAWRDQRRALDTSSFPHQGKIARLDRSGDGTTVYFVKEKVPLVDRKCRETNRIDRIEDGKIIYREECTTKSLGTTMVAPQPVKISDASGLSAGRYVRIALDTDQRDGLRGAVLTSSSAPEDAGKLYRIADLVFD